MAKTPFDIASTQTVAGLMNDIATKLDSIRAAEQIAPFDIPHFENVNQVLGEEQKKVDSVRKAWKTYGDNLKKILNEKKKYVRTELELEKSYTAQKKSLDKLGTQIDKNSEAYKKAAVAVERLKEEYEDAQKAVVGFAKEEKKYKEQALKHATKEFGAKAFDKATSFGLKTGVSLLMSGFRVFQSSVSNVYDMLERFRGASAAVAGATGGGAGGVQSLTNQMFASYLGPGGLGDLGMGLDQVAGEFAGFAEAMTITDLRMNDMSNTLITHGKLMGMNGQEVGDLARSYQAMGLRADEADEAMGRVMKNAQALGLNTKATAKNVFVLGKNLLDSVGPKYQQQMQDAIVKTTKLGISVKTLESFTQMTDTFDQAADSMAKLNTAFGLHINAMDMFLEDDPSKRFEMIREQLFLQGKDYETLNRREKRMITEVTGLTAEEINMMTVQGQTFDEMTEKMEAREAAQVDWQRAMDDLKTTLLPMARLIDRILQSVYKALGPFFKQFGISGEAGKTMGAFGKFAEQIEQKIVAIVDSLAKNDKFIGAMKGLGDSIIKFLDNLSKPETQERIVGFITRIAESMDDWLGILEKIGSWFAGGWGAGAVISAVASLSSVGAIAAMSFMKLISKVGNLKDLLSSLGGGGGIISGVKGALSSLGSTAGKALTFVGSKIGGIWSSVSGMAARVAPYVGRAAMWAGRGVASAAMGTAGAVAGAGLAGAGIGYAAYKTNFLGVNDMMQSAFDSMLGAPGETSEGPGEDPTDYMAPRKVGGPVFPGQTVKVNEGKGDSETFTAAGPGRINSSVGSDRPIIVQLKLDSTVISEVMLKELLRSAGSFA